MPHILNALVQWQADASNMLMSSNLVRFWVHDYVTHAPLLPQILNALAPVQRQADASGASNMLTSSYTLARSLADIPSQVESLTALDLILIK